MALSRKFLSALGIEPEKIDEIITAHSETVTALKEERDTYKEDAEKYKAESEKVADLEQKVKEYEGLKDGETKWQKKYEELKSEYDTYKGDVSAKETKRAKEAAYRKLLLNNNVSEKRLDTIMKVTNLDELELDEKGEFKEAEKIADGIKTEWADFIVAEGKKGAESATPPANNPDPNKGSSRAAMLAEQYHNNIYGDSKKED